MPVVGLSPGWPGSAWSQFLWIVLVYPLLEELVFRGGLQPWVADKTAAVMGPVSLANLVTSLGFTALHFIYHPPFWAAGVFFPSLIFGYFRERHQSLASPIFLHIFYNASYLMLLAKPPPV